MKLIDISTPKHSNMFAMVDDEDFERINAHKWFAHQSHNSGVIYAARRVRVNGRRTIIRMHREVLGEGCASIIDHRDMSGLNNQKSNLRPATKRQNGFNRQITPGSRKTSKYRGVRKRVIRGCEYWDARIGGGGAYLGAFPTEEKAHEAYVEAAKRIYGEFVPTKLIKGMRNE